jgi:hypothetical protein
MTESEKWREAAEANYERRQGLINSNEFWEIVQDINKGVQRNEG